MKKAALLISIAALTGCLQEASDIKTSLSSEDIQNVENLQIDRLFLQQLSANSVMIKWRGNKDKVSLGKSPDELDLVFEASIEAGHRIAKVSNLEPDTSYFYSIGNRESDPQTHRFRTAPLTGSLPSDGDIRFWLLGDSGTATEFDRDGNPSHPGEAEAVLNGFLSYNSRAI